MPINDGLFRTQVLNAPPDRVDRKRNIIFGAKVIELGPVNDDRPWDVDETTLAQVFDYMSRPNKGLKARFTHPGLSDDGLGKYLGRWQNPRIVGPALVADLHLAKVAFDSPSGDLGTYSMDLADEDPEAFGISVATKLHESMFAETEPGQRLPLRIVGLHAADIVDSPAATRGGMFDSHTQDSIPAVVAWILNKHFAQADPAEVLQRFSAFLGRHYGQEIENMDKDPESTGPSAPLAPEAPVGLSRAEAQPFMDHFGAQGAQWFLEGKELAECFGIALENEKAENASLRDMVANLQKQLSAAVEATGEAEPFSAGSAPIVEGSDLKARRAAKAAELRAKGYSDASARWTAGFEIKS